MAQCQGTTRKGERCTRDAHGDGAYCIIHLDQEVRAPRAKEIVEWDRKTIATAALGVALASAIVFFRIRR